MQPMLPPSEGLYFVEKTRSNLPEGLENPSAFLTQFHPLSARAAKFINSKAFYCTLPKGKHLLKEGTVCTYMFLLHKGLMRAYLKDGKTEVTTWISKEGELVSAISSFFSQSPSQEGIQAIEDSELIALPFQDLETAYQRFPEINMHVRIILQILYQKAEERAYLSRLTKASSRYQFFVERRPDLINRTPLKFIASHLGMTLETLSRLRNAISKPDNHRSKNSF